ncbi:hypothetical protein ACM43_12865 [Bradyrhizobium sp. CCBAU 45321]|uniref:hypothetical protein n=1 Tax=Bradyrhizobium sp. CCBAU 45321 TaxID=1641878 RepID=UPI0023025675|nr:hypothetical protein [Bradyrhizobium sp. CCBAU 45321]MDA9545317.1 hypothetical protein [Bradyrhizobium sp. CCBAU 45321]
MSAPIAPADKQTLKAFWVEVAPSAQTAGPEKQAFRGVNLRLDLLKSLRATWETVKVAGKIKLALYAPPDLASILEIGVESISAAQAIYESFVQTMRPIDYVTYIVLARSPDGMTETELKTAVDEFLDKQSDYAEVSWYLRISGERLDRARQARQGNWMKTALEKLLENDMISRESDKVCFKPRHYTFGWKPD